MELWKAYEETKEELKYYINEMEKYGLKKAETERNYKIILKQNVLKQKAEGVAVGIIDKTCYGIDEVANARFERDTAEVMYETSKERINASKINLRILDSQMNREWSSIN